MPQLLLGFSTLAWFCVGAIVMPIFYVAVTQGLPTWCKANGERMFLMACAFFVGAFVTAMIGNEPSDGIMTLVGSFAGIGAALGGGLWLWQLQEAQSAARVIAAVDNHLLLVISAFAGLDEALDENEPGNKQRWASIAIEEVYSALERLRRIEPHLIETNPHFQVAYAKVELLLRRLSKEELKDLERAARDVAINTERHDQLNVRLAAQNQLVSALLLQARHQLQKIAPGSMSVWPKK